MASPHISQALLHRLPGYLNYLKSLPGGDHYISATTIANALGLGDVQVRKDLAAISEAGRRRTGRSRDQLIRDIESYLGFSSSAPTVVLGAGAMGQAFLDYSGFDHSGLNILACFDRDPAIHHSRRGRPVYPMDHLVDFCRANQVQVGIIALPAEDAQWACDILTACGIRAVWNLTPIHLRVPDGVAIHNENFAASVSTLLALMRETKS